MREGLKVAAASSLRRESVQASITPLDRRQVSERTSCPEPDAAISTHGLTKLYRNPWTMKQTRGVEDFDLDVRRGEVLGFLGPNGAGKTTTLKILVGLHKATRGRAWLLG